MNEAPHPIVRQIVDRDCHVSLTNEEVIDHVISKLRHGMETFRVMPQEERDRLVRDCTMVHEWNRQLYRDVMFPSYRSHSPE